MTRQFTGAALVAVESIRQHGVDDRAFEDPVQRPGGADGVGSFRRPGNLVRRALSPVCCNRGDGRLRERLRHCRCGSGARFSWSRGSTASAISSIDGFAGSDRAGTGLRSLLRPTSGALAVPVGDWLSTTLLANRLSYSRRFSSSQSGPAAAAIWGSS